MFSAIHVFVYDISSMSILAQCLPSALYNITAPSLIISSPLSTHSLLLYLASPYTQSRHFLLASLHHTSQSRQTVCISLGLDSRPNDTLSKFWSCLLYVSMFVGPSRTLSRACSVSSGGTSVFVTSFLHQLLVSLLQ